MKKKPLGLPILISLVIGNMIGTGIYILPATLAEFGTISLLSWIFTAVGAVFLALTFANLNKQFPQTGGSYVYCKEAFGVFSGFTVAYMYWICNLISIAGIAVASVGYLGFITPNLNANSNMYHPYLALGLELLAVWFFTLINIIGVHAAGVVQVLLTMIKIAPLLIISLLGLGRIEIGNLEEFTLGPESDFSAMSNAAAITFFAFIGLESATVPSESASNSRDIFRATVYGTCIAAVVYILCTFVLMGMIPSDHLKNSQFPMAQAATMLFGPKAAVLIALCAVISGFAALNGCILLQGQIVFAGARDQYFPRLFANVSKHGSAFAGQLFSCFIITGFLILTVEPTLLKQFNSIALLAAFLTLVTYVAATLAQIKLLLCEHKPITSILFSKSMIIAVIAAIYAFWMISNFESKIIYTSAVIIGMCVPLYFLKFKRPLLLRLGSLSRLS